MKKTNMRIYRSKETLQKALLDKRKNLAAPSADREGR